MDNGEDDARRVLDGWRRLVVLLKSQSGKVRKQGIEKLGQEIDRFARLAASEGEKYRLHCFAEILSELCVICVNGEWEARVAAGRTLALGLVSFYMDDDRFTSVTEYLKRNFRLMSFESFDLNDVLERARPLVSRPDSAYGQRNENVDFGRERFEMLRNLRFASMNHPTDNEDEDDHANNMSSNDPSMMLLEEGDFAQQLKKEPMHKRVELTCLLSSSSNKRKSTADSGDSVRVAAVKRLKIAEKEEGKPSEEEKDLNSMLHKDQFLGQQDLDSVVAYLWVVMVQHLLSDRWEARHGAASGLLEILIRKRGSDDKSLEAYQYLVGDIVVRCLCVLGLDRFGDYASDSLVAPVRESCAQLLSLSICSLPVAEHERSVGILCGMVERNKVVLAADDDDNNDKKEEDSADMAKATLWGKRYGALLALKYMVVSLNGNDEMLWKVLPTMSFVLIEEVSENLSPGKRVLRDTAVYNDDIRRAACDVVLACISPKWCDPTYITKDVEIDKDRITHVFRIFSGVEGKTKKTMQHSIEAIWHLVSLLNDVTMVSGTSIIILGALGLFVVNVKVNLHKLLAPKLSHSVSKVRKATLSAIRMLLSRGQPIMKKYFPEGNDRWLKVLLERYLVVIDDAERDGEEDRSGLVKESLLIMEVWKLLAESCTSRINLKTLFDTCLKHMEMVSTDDSKNPDLSWKLLSRGASALAAIYSKRKSDKEFQAVLTVNDQSHFLLVLQTVCCYVSNDGVEEDRNSALSEVMKMYDANKERDWGLHCEPHVRFQRSAMVASCSFLCHNFLEAGLDRSVLESGDKIIAQFMDVGKSDDLSNEDLVKGANKLVMSQCLEWVNLLEKPSSREAARQWNESTTAARQGVLDHVNSFELARDQVKMMAEGVVAAIRLFTYGDLPEEVTITLRNLLRPFTVTEMAFEMDGDVLQSLSSAFVRLMNLLKDTPSKRKALEKVPLKLVNNVLKTKGRSLLPLETLVRHAKSSELKEMLPSVLALVEKLFPLEGEVACDDTGNNKLEGQARCVMTICSKCFLNQEFGEMIVRHIPSMIKWFKIKPTVFAGELQLVLEAAMESCAILRAFAWKFVSQFLVGELEKSKVAMELLQRLLKLDSSLPYVAGFFPIVMNIMQNSPLEEVRASASSCFADLVEVSPVESRAKDETEDPILVDQRIKGQSFIRGLVDGVYCSSSSMSAGAKDPYGILPICEAREIELRPYQLEGVNWLCFLARHGLHGALCDDLGLGKTLMSLTCVVANRMEERKRHLIICPSSLTGHWVEEINRWFKGVLEPVACVGSPAQRSAIMESVCSMESEVVLVISYSLAARDFSDLAKFDWNYVILDEAHTIRNPHIVASKGCKTIGLCAKNRMALTGTPVHNDVTDLWSVFDFLMPGFLGSLDHFEQEVAKPIRTSRGTIHLDKLNEGKGSARPYAGKEKQRESNNDDDDDDDDEEEEEEEEEHEETGQGEMKKKNKSKREQQKRANELKALKALESLHRRVLPFILRRLKADVLKELPPKIIQDVLVDLSPTQEKIYNELFEDAHGDLLAATTGSGKHKSILGHLTRLLMTCTHPVLAIRNLLDHCKNRLHRRGISNRLSAAKEQGVNGSSKFVALEEILRNNILSSQRHRGDTRLKTLTNQERHKAIIFAQWKGTLDLIEEQLLKQALKNQLLHLRLDGSIDPHKRQAVASRFNADENVDILLSTTKVGGQGLNLTGADMVIFVEHDWNPMNDLQAMDRAHRIGQSRSVNVFRIITRNTIEERLMGLQHFKIHIASKVVNDQNQQVSTMYTDRILDMLYEKNESMTKNDKEGHDGKTKGLKSVMDQVGNLWGEEQYDDYDVSKFGKLF